MSIIADINNLPSTLPLPATRSSPIEWENQKEQWGQFLNDQTFSILENLLVVFKESSTYLINNSFKKLDNLTNEDLNTIYGTQNNGFRLQPLTSNATLARNYPINQAGTLITFSTQDEYTIQIYISYQGNSIFMRTNKISDETSWNSWISSLFSKDIINDLTTGGVNSMLSAEQGKILDSSKLNVLGGIISGSLQINENLTVNNALNSLKGYKINGSDTIIVDPSNILIIGNNIIDSIKLRSSDGVKPAWSDYLTGTEILRPFALQEDITNINNSLTLLNNKINTPLKANNSLIGVAITKNVLYECQLTNSTIFSWTIDNNSSDPILNINSLIQSNQLRQKIVNKQVNRFNIKLNIKFALAPTQSEILEVRLLNNTLGNDSKIILIPATNSDIITSVDFTTITTSTDGYTLAFYSSVDITELKIISITRI